MAGARQHTALPPREPPRARPAPAPRPELSRTAASRPRPRWLGPAPPLGSRPDTSPFREQFENDKCPPTTAAIPSPWGCTAAFTPKQLRLAVPPACWLDGRRSGDYRCHLPASLPVVAARGLARAF